MQMPPVEEGARKRARVSRGPIVLAAIINGISLAEISKSENIPIKRGERRLREELPNRWMAPFHDHAAIEGHLPTIERLLKVLDRLDRHHGFAQLAATRPARREDGRARLIANLEQAARTPARGQ